MISHKLLLKTGFILDEQHKMTQDLLLCFVFVFNYVP